MLALFVVTSVVFAVGGCGRETTATLPAAAPDAARFAEELRQQVSADAMMGHLQKLQDIANANGNTRAIGTPGYDASVDYVANTLRDKGFDVQTPEFELSVFSSEPGTVVLGGTAPGGMTAAAKALEYTVGTPPDGVSAPLVPAKVSDSPGCDEADYDGLPVTGAIVLVDRGTCQFSKKAASVVARGAVGLVVADNVDEKEMGGTLGEDNDIKIPVVSVSKADGATLRANPGPVTIKVNASTQQISARNVIAQTTTGSGADVVMTGAHLDSVPEGPGINDNGSGVAAVLETALQLGSAPQVRNAVRFGFWGAEEKGLVGSEKYIESLNVDQLKDIALYLNFDMLGSPNPGYLTYDGDQSTAIKRTESAPRVPEGSAGIERALVAYLKGAGKTAQDTAFDGRSDYDGFTMAGIPSGGLFAGAEDKMTAEQAKLWGGTADQPFDPNYHKSTDTIDHIDRTALDIQGGGVAYIVGQYAQEITGRNGVPVRGDRTRHVIQPS